jgi:transcriptional regulator with XRE-family HTH domain
MTLGDKIKDVRKKRGFSQGELAEKVGISAVHMNRLEKGKFQPSIQVISKIAEVLEVSVDYLLNEESEALPEIKIKNKPLAERVKLMDTLDEEDQNALIQVIDSMLTKKRMKDLLSKTPVNS